MSTLERGFLALGGAIVMRRILPFVVACLPLAGCLERCATAVTPVVQSAVRIPITNNAIEDVDILFAIDNSGSMLENQATLARNLGVLVDALVNPPINPQTMRPLYPQVKSLHLGVVSSDLGTPGSVVPSCANTDVGDNGLLNPIRNGLSMRAHQPWSTPAGARRPARCTNDPNQFPSFLRFDRASSNAEVFRDEAVCNAYLSTGGCGLEQQLESAYRALVVHNARATPGNTSPNAGFVRDNAVLAILMVTDEEDGSVRDCRYAERGVPCTEAVSVFDVNAPQWSSNDLNLRMYMYAPGSAQDPTWPLDRYIDPRNPNRGFTSLKPGRPDLVVFSAIAGVPINLPTRQSGSQTRIDWGALLGANPDGSDGYTGTSAEGPISMRQRNADPACSTRVVPACRREGSTATAGCDAAAQYVAMPSRRVAEVVRRFDERYDNGALTSICKNDYRGALDQLVERIQTRLQGRCLPRPLETSDAPCEPGSGQRGCVQTRCVVREILPAGVSAASVCTAARGRTPGERDPELRRDTCIIRQLAAAPGGAPPAGREGFFYDTRPDPASPDCRQNVSFTAAAQPMPGATAVVECVQMTSEASNSAPSICR